MGGRGEHARPPEAHVLAARAAAWPALCRRGSTPGCSAPRPRLSRPRAATPAAGSELLPRHGPGSRDSRPGRPRRRPHLGQRPRLRGRELVIELHHQLGQSVNQAASAGAGALTKAGHIERSPPSYSACHAHGTKRHSQELQNRRCRTQRSRLSYLAGISSGMRPAQPWPVTRPPVLRVQRGFRLKRRVDFQEPALYRVD